MPNNQPQGAALRTVVILGAGQIGQAIALKLLDAGGYALLVADRNAASLQRLHALTGVATAHIQDAGGLESVIAGGFAVLNPPHRPGTRPAASLRDWPGD